MDTAFSGIHDNTVPSTLLEIDGQPISWEYYGDVCIGSPHGSKVRVKRLFSPPDGAGRSFYEEAVLWKRLEHPNIASIRGIAINSHPPQLISCWVSGRNLTEYIKGHPGADQLSLVGAPPISDG